MEKAEQFKLLNLNQVNAKIVKKLRKEYQILGETLFSTTIYKKTKSSKGKVRIAEIVEWTEANYQKEMELILLKNIQLLKKKQIEIVINKNVNLIKNFCKDADSIRSEIHNYCFNLAEKIFKKGHLAEVYTENPKLLEKSRLQNEVLVRKIYKEEAYTTELSVLLKQIQNLNEISISKAKQSKWSGISSNSNSLFKILWETLESRLSCNDKQVAIEKAVFEYDLEFFKINFNNERTTTNVQIFVKEYANMVRNYDLLINDYILYRALKLKNLFKQENSNAVIILILIYFNKDRTINLVFKLLLDLIMFKNPHLEGKNKTVLLMSLAKNFTKRF
jgi:hypothetical protein